MSNQTTGNIFENFNVDTAKKDVIENRKRIKSNIKATAIGGCIGIGVSVTVCAVAACITKRLG